MEPRSYLDQLQHEIREQCLDQHKLSLSSYALSLTGLELTPYNEYLLNLREKMPALNHLGFLASDGTWYRWNDSDAPEEDLEYERQYECLQYNELIDKKDRDDSFFTISGEKDEE